MVVHDLRWKSYISKKGVSERTDQLYFTSMEAIDAGEIVCLGTGRYQWTIDDFLSKVSTTNRTVASPWFSYMDFDYWIGINIQKGENVLGLSFTSKQSTSRLHVRLGMNTRLLGTRDNRCGELDVDGYFEVHGWMRYTELKARKNTILSGGKLTVFCDLRRQNCDESPAALQEKPPAVGEEKVEKAHSEDHGTGPESKILKKLQTDLKTILDSEEDCDVTIKVRGKEFLAHSIFLRARSPVFKSMFSHEMVEKLSGVVAIDDCEPGTFPDLLNYLYTGSTKHISDENVCQLYTVSDKYQVQELKEECAAYMKENMSVDNFCDILGLALRHFEKELIDLSTDFFCANVTDVAKTSAWHAFLRENTTAGNELFLKFVSREKQK